MGLGGGKEMKFYIIYARLTKNGEVKTARFITIFKREAMMVRDLLSRLEITNTLEKMEEDDDRPIKSFCN